MTDVYRKANSFLGVHQAAPEVDVIRGRVAALLSRIDRLDLSDYRSRVVTRACRDILDEQATDDGSRMVLHGYVGREIAALTDEELPRYLFYRYRYEVHPAQRVLDDFPPCLQVEPASICNYRCVFCYQTDPQLTTPGNGHMGLMPLDLFKRVVDDAEGQCEALTLASRGEPLINKDIDRFLEYAGGKFLALKINTNAWFLDERKIHAILQAGVGTVVFSADAASEPAYSQLRVGGNLDRVLANVRRFQEIRSRDYPNSRTLSRVSGVHLRDDQSLAEMTSLWGDLVDQVAFVKYIPWENCYERPVNDISTPCSDLWRRMFVWHDGRVNPCDVDYRSTLSVGDATRESLTSIWTGERYSELRERHAGGDRGSQFPCNRCNLV